MCFPMFMLLLLINVSLLSYVLPFWPLRDTLFLLCNIYGNCIMLAIYYHRSAYFMMVPVTAHLLVFV